MEHQPTLDVPSYFASNLSRTSWKSEEFKKKTRTDVSTNLTLWDNSWDCSVSTSTQFPNQDEEKKQVELLFAREKEKKRMTANLRKMKFYSPEDLEEEMRQGVSTLLNLYGVDPVMPRMKKKEQVVVLSGAEKKRKRVSAKLESMRFYSPEELEEERRQGVSTKLKLYDNPFKIRRRLTGREIGTAGRLRVGTEVVQKHVLRFLDDEEIKLVGGEGLKVGVWDMDTRTLHQLVLKNWDDSKSYVFSDKWDKDFVQRRNLKEGDKVGLFWDVRNARFSFTVFR